MESGHEHAGGGGAPLHASSLASVLDDCTDIVVLTDLAGTILYVNRACTFAFGERVAPGRCITDTDVLAVWDLDLVAFEQTLRGLLANPEEHGCGEVTRARRNMCACAWRSRTIRGHAGTPIGRSFVFRHGGEESELMALKSDFLSTVTHELRTPLTSVKGSLQLVLGKSTALAPVERELLGISLKNADRLIRLINDLLDISRLELGKLDIAVVPIATGALVQEAVAGLRAYGSGRDVAIGCDIEPELAPVYGDRDRLIQVLTNLISNAVKFSSAGGRVVVHAYREGDDVAIAIRDWGMGIRKEDLNRLFRRFQRLHPERTTEPGTGLGLAISKAILDHHGGRIVVESEENEGSTFTVILPIAPASTRTTSRETTSDGGRSETHAAAGR